MQVSTLEQADVKERARRDYTNIRNKPELAANETGGRDKTTTHYGGANYPVSNLPFACFAKTLGVFILDC